MYLFKKAGNDGTVKNAGQFLQIMAAEEQNLIKVEANIGNLQLFENDVREAITSDLYSALGKEWNSERGKVIDLVMSKFLFPSIVKGLKEKLAAEATDAVIDEAVRRLEYDIAMSGWKSRALESASAVRRTDTPVMAMSWGDGEKIIPLMCVVLDAFGNLMDQTIFTRLQDIATVREREMERLKRHIKDHNVEVIVMSGSAPNTRTRLYEDVKRLIEESSLRTEVFILDDAVAKIYMNSKRGMEDLPTQDVNWDMVRYCVSLGRMALDPTMEYAGLVNSDNDILKLQLTPLQHLLPVEKFLHAIERSFCNLVNQMYVA